MGNIVLSIEACATWELLTEFQTVKNGDFTPIVVGTGDFKWVIDGVEYLNLSPTIPLTGATIDVELYGMNTPLVTEFKLFGDDTAGDVDLSHEAFYPVEIIQIWNATKGVDTLTLPTTNNGLGFRNLTLYNLDITSLDLSTFTDYDNGNISVNLIPLTSLTLPATMTGEVTYVGFSNLALTSLDISVYDTLGTNTSFYISDNVSLASLVLPTISSGEIGTIAINGNSLLTSTIDLTSYTNFKTNANIRIYENDILTTINLPTTNTAILQQIRIEDNALLSSITNQSNFDIVASSVVISNNPNITTFDMSGWDFGNYSEINITDMIGLTNLSLRTTPTTDEVYYVRINNVAATSLDLSLLGNVTTEAQVEIENVSATSITMPSSFSGSVEIFKVNITSVSTLDISAINTISSNGEIQVRGNSNLTTIILPTSYLGNNIKTFDISQNGVLTHFSLPTFTTIMETNSSALDFSQNGWSTAEVNQTLVEVDTFYTDLGYTGSTFDLGTNSAPDGSSGGYDGVTAKANLIAKNLTVVTD